LDNLPGEGRPLPFDVLTPDRRELLLTLKVLSRPDELPEEPNYRRRIDELLLHLDVAKVEHEVIGSVSHFNERVHREDRRGLKPAHGKS
jgi:hypothetical protein